MKKASFFLIFLWTLHLLSFVFKWNYFPLIQYDLFARPQNFNNSAEYFYAKTSTTLNHSIDISQDISFGAYWKFIVTVRRILREDPERLASTLKKRISELNENRKDKIESVQFVEIDKRGLAQILFEVSMK